MMLLKRKIRNYHPLNTVSCHTELDSGSSMRFLLSVLALATAAAAYSPLLPPKPARSFPQHSAADVGEPLFLTPYIEAGDLETARGLARVDATLLEGGHSDIESYAGLITVDEANNGNMFFWFFPAEEAPETAPVLIWLQGGPGSSSMFGLLKLHGPILTATDENGNLGVEDNPFSWNKKHNIIYIDNPVGAGFSFSNKLTENEDDVARNLYNMLQQWFTLFPMYQANEFFPFGESYAGKYVPAISKKIDMENENPDNIRINLSGLGIGDGWMDPINQARYGDFLYYFSLIDENAHNESLRLEAKTAQSINAEDWIEAFYGWNNELGYVMNAMDYEYIYELRQSEYDPTEDDYEDFCNMASTRQALHVGNLEYPNSGDVYGSMLADFMHTSKHDIEYLLEKYRVLIYDGNLDIIVNHSGVVGMVKSLEWSGSETYARAGRSNYKYGSELVGYLKQADNLNLLLVRNSGHMVPMSQPAWALQMLNDFTANRL